MEATHAAAGHNAVEHSAVKHHQTVASRVDGPGDGRQRRIAATLRRDDGGAADVVRGQHHHTRRDGAANAAAAFVVGVVVQLVAGAVRSAVGPPLDEPRLPQRWKTRCCDALDVPQHSVETSGRWQRR